jgi:hypothetical protein
MIGRRSLLIEPLRNFLSGRQTADAGKQDPQLVFRHASLRAPLLMGTNV